VQRLVGGEPHLSIILRLPTQRPLASLHPGPPLHPQPLQRQVLLVDLVLASGNTAPAGAKDFLSRNKNQPATTRARQTQVNVKRLFICGAARLMIHPKYLCRAHGLPGRVAKPAPRASAHVCASFLMLVVMRPRSAGGGGVPRKYNDLELPPMEFLLALH
jgi:hypothetical protein